MKVDADTTEMNEAERREAVKAAPGLDDPADRDDGQFIEVVDEGGE